MEAPLNVWSSVQYVTMQRYLSRPSFSCLFIPNPPIKLKHGLQIGERLLIITHVNKSNYLAN
jgi:hypothetical protein